MLEGDNAYFCEKCEKKVNTLKRCCIKRMPNNLFLVLKRFEFDFDTMQKVKLNDYCEFPERINFKKWTKEGIDDPGKEEEVEDEIEEDPKILPSGGSRKSKMRKSTEFIGDGGIDAAETADPLNLSVELKNDSLEVED